MNSTAQLIQALLFYKGEPLTKENLVKTLVKTEREIDEAIIELREVLTGQGIVLIEINDTYALATSHIASNLLEALKKEELSKDLSKASVETLAIIAYTGSVSRAEIDYIRGVNSSFILRALLIRRLIDKIPNPKDARTFLYRPSPDLLSYFGISTETSFPDYEKFHNTILELLRNNAVETNKENNEKDTTTEKYEEES
ncbi:MAG: SMC-Scp complex subunit ScpB [Candidatus Pacebacteria bacterium]|nr:SMC-Scp complex subunit ScpB [Candidatus Paceibacterota bacterium]